LTNLFSLLHAQVISTFAGSGSQGAANGTGTAASFFNPTGVAVDGSGNVYVADQANNLIRKITPAGLVSWFAGGGQGAADGTAASFYAPTGIAIDGSGNVYVGDQENHLIRKITPTGAVSTFAGSGSVGFSNGIGTAASFSNPAGVAVDASCNVYVADVYNNSIRMITPAGVVSTLAGSGAYGFANGAGTAASFNHPTGVAVDVLGDVYVADKGNHLIRKITPAGVVSTLAGSGTNGYSNGTSTTASFNNPTGLAVDGSGNVYVADEYNNRIRKITSSGVVSTFAGSGNPLDPSGKLLPGSGPASFYAPSAVAVDVTGDFYVADTKNNRIRKITGIPAGIEELISVSDMKLYPIPAKQTLTLALTLQVDGNLRLGLINISGIEVASMEGNYDSGFNKLLLSVGALPAGIYVANIYFNGQVKSQKILIER
jgi:sugar lactone lactonase YvrE